MIVIPTFAGEPEEGEEDHRAKYGSPTGNLSGDVKGPILDPNCLWEEIDATEVVVCVRPVSPRRKWVRGDVEIDLENRYGGGAHKFHPSERH